MHVAGSMVSTGRSIEQVRLCEEGRTKRRTVADALEVVRQEGGGDQIVSACIRIFVMEFPSKELIALVDVVFPELGRRVSLPASSRFSARPDTRPERQEFPISCLGDAVVKADGSVVLSNGTCLRAVEVIPTNLFNQPSALDEKILCCVIALTKANCIRNLRDEVPEYYRDQIPDWWVLDHTLVRMIKAPQLKVIRGYIADNCSDLQVSLQKISDTLKKFEIRIPRRRPRAKPAAATI